MSKVACVTGADRGLGHALTVEMLQRGYTVYAGQYMPQWEALGKLSDEWPSRIRIVRLDISSEESVREAAGRIASEAGRLDILINNAGIIAESDKTSSVFGEIDYGQIQRMYAVNALGPLRMVQALSGLLMNGETKLVVNISSEAGQVGQAWREGWYGYCMSKSALNVQSNILHNELRRRGGKVLVVHPGWMKTYMGGELSEEGDLTAEEAASQIAAVIHRHSEDGTERAHPLFVDYKGEEMAW
ncbi:SDR family NAD(P)-dependent oxidoreductase [Cohnella caldifontis]|uniref:SDR family NAD(P)-dependent oxidoreductase n=1 Tax=Cohnella caldifontis TaxID=3027471 RepID=UPI0023EAA882|nr:SDR family NAD(P)-dependent oxidoreductase [Cohnella sp. YIM B05605]